MKIIDTLNKYTLFFQIFVIVIAVILITEKAKIIRVVDKDYGTYNFYVNTNNSYVTALASTIKSKCGINFNYYDNNTLDLLYTETYTNPNCVVSELYSYFQDLNYIEDAKNKTIDYTIEQGGNCENYAILGASVLLNLNMTDTYFLFQEKHMCILTENKFLNCLQTDFTGIEKVEAKL